MCRTSLLIGLFVAFAVGTGVSAQQINSIFDAFQGSTTANGKGEVVVDQPVAIRNMVGTRRSTFNSEGDEGETYKIQGFRVQVFSGNNQRKSKDEAFKKEKEVNESFPLVTTYVTYTAPFWRLRVGDYRSHEEAYFMLRQLTNKFSSYGKEMYIIKEEVKIPIQ